MLSEGLIDVTFENSALQALLASLKRGQSLSAVQLLTALDSESEEILEDALEELRRMDVFPDITDLPNTGADTETAVRLRREEQLAKQGILMESLDENDPLRMYLQELAGIPACGDICLLAQQLRQEPTEETVRAALMNLCLSRVAELAVAYTGHGVLLMDLIQEGSMGLWESLLHYNGEDIEAFRDYWIRWHMAKAVVLQAYAGGVGQRLRQMVEDYRSVDEKLLAELGRNPTVQEVAEGLHISLEEAMAAARMLENARMLHRTQKPEPEVLPQEENQAVEDTAYFQMRQRIMELMSSLSEQDAKLLTLRYGLEGGIPLNPQQTGSRMGMTPEEVVAKESEILAKLRKKNEFTKEG